MTPLVALLVGLVASTLVVALTVPGFVLAVRALPAVDRRALSGQKPWACDVCMCFWSTAIWTVVVALVFKDARLLLAAGPAYTVSMLVLRVASAPLGEGPMPPLEPSGLAEKLEP